MRKQLSLAPLIAATYFMVAGGPYGLEELVANAGYVGAMLALVLTPLLWSLPTALMVGELGSALPDDGGFYVWVKRALGPFWGFQEAWLSLTASIFDMAIYPTLLMLYIGRLWPALGEQPLLLGGAMIAACAAWNLRGAASVGRSAVVLTVLLLLPFVVLVAITLQRPDPPLPTLTPPSLHGVWAGVLVAMWNLMGWDNASTIAGEVHRPQRTYPLAMLLAVALVTLTYVIPVGAIWHLGVDPRGLTTGSWVDIGLQLGGRWLSRAIALGGALTAVSMFNALVLSYSHLPTALAHDRLLPAWLAKRNARGAPWASIMMLSAAYAACLKLGFVRLVELDVMLYGLSLVLEFVALAWLRLREPSLSRPFKIPGGTVVVLLIGVPPTALIVAALTLGRHERAGRLPALALGSMLVLAGPIVYWMGLWLRRKRWLAR